LSVRFRELPKEHLVRSPRGGRRRQDLLKRQLEFVVRLLAERGVHVTTPSTSARMPVLRRTLRSNSTRDRSPTQRDPDSGNARTAACEDPLARPSCGLSAATPKLRSRQFAGRPRSGPG